jgi:hypothetical protein
MAVRVECEAAWSRQLRCAAWRSNPIFFLFWVSVNNAATQPATIGQNSWPCAGRRGGHLQVVLVPTNILGCMRCC